MEQGRGGLAGSLVPLVVDVAVPTGAYYVLGRGCGFSDVSALAWSSVVPVGRALWGLVAERRLNWLAAVMLVSNVLALAVSVFTGDARLLLIKDSVLMGSGGLCVLVAAGLFGRPVLNAVLKPWVTRGEAGRGAAWERLADGGGAFAGLARQFSLLVGGGLLVESVVRIVGAYTVPVSTMVSVGPVVSVGIMLLVVKVAVRRSVRPMASAVDREAVRQRAGARPLGSAVEFAA
ncbi:VC0807 family protein [Streptomyces beihaiensis]|uniref:Intracellular septation protein A n=1 Tax=Streptomyces beihaiensis TaxID=2984495 RepID=A0ABT3TS47_9ACTN|nr:VC0807 family protein [Streptomyces beihaiensis]MCX3059864.1 hypothetical protein [Streptomyces beihaiensis]